MITRPSTPTVARMFKQIKPSSLRGVFRIVPPRSALSNALMPRIPAKPR
ncbi:MAG: hypothetical protein ACR2FI_04620 [Burkholderiales bacterium]|nr:hypothetical protein [Burkholderiales bacterium]MDQ3197558.1 hypothetical protein [Pseudomonadota bacterium]